MPKSIPFIIRRRDIFAFRIGVPKELRASIGCREIIRSLHTSNRKIAEPIALELAANTKRLFNKLRLDMTIRKNKNGVPREDELLTNYEVQIDIGGLSLPIKFKGNGEIHEQEAINQGIKTFVDSIGQYFPNSIQDNKSILPKSKKISVSPLLSEVINKFLSSNSVINRGGLAKLNKAISEQVYFKPS